VCSISNGAYLLRVDVYLGISPVGKGTGALKNPIYFSEHLSKHLTLYMPKGISNSDHTLHGLFELQNRLGQTLV
jgi:hypothetical protein